MTNADKKTLQAIESGRYRNNYLVYARRSTDDTDHQKNSISYQKSENIRFAQRNNLPLASVALEGFCTDGLIAERHSGFAEDSALSFGQGNLVQFRVDRPKFHRLAHFLHARYFKGAIFLCWDRASRNKGDDTILRKLMRSGVDVRFTLTQYGLGSAGELHMDIDGMFSAHHSRVTSERIRLTIKDKSAQGLWVHRAGVGYLNEGNSNWKPFDPERSPFVRAFFENLATGEWSLPGLARWAARLGFTMPPIRRRRTVKERLSADDSFLVPISPISRLPTANTIHQIVTNRFYTGRVLSQGVWIPSKCHAPLVSDELFERVQRRLQRRRVSAHYSHTLDLPLRGMIRCGECSRVYTPYEQKSHTYYGARCKEGCTNRRKSISFTSLAEEVRSRLARLTFSEAELAQLEEAAKVDGRATQEERAANADAARKQTARARSDLTYLDTNRTSLLRTGAFTAERLAEEEARLKAELAALEQAVQPPAHPFDATVRASITLSELLKALLPLYDSPKPQHKEQIVRVVFSELTILGNTAKIKARTGAAALDDRFLVTGAPNTWISELCEKHDDIVESIRDIEECIAQIEMDHKDIA